MDRGLDASGRRFFEGSSAFCGALGSFLRVQVLFEVL